MKRRLSLKRKQNIKNPLSRADIYKRNKMIKKYIIGIKFYNNHQSFREKIKTKRNKFYYIGKERVKPIIHYLNFHREMRKTYFYYFKKSNFKTQVRIGLQSITRNIQYYKLMNENDFIERKIECFDLDIIDRHNFVYFYVKNKKDEYSEKYQELLNCDSHMDILFDDFDLNICDYIIENDLVCVAIFNEGYYKEIGIKVYSNDEMPKDLYKLLNY